MSQRKSPSTPSESQRRDEAVIARSAVVLIASIMQALTARRDDDSDTSSDEEAEAEPFLLDEEGPCTSTGPETAAHAAHAEDAEDAEDAARRECYITEDARRNEIRMQEQFILRSASAHCHHHHHHHHRYHQGDPLETMPVTIPRPRYSPASFSFPGGQPSTAARKRKYGDDGEDATGHCELHGAGFQHHPGLAFSCDPDRMHLSDSAAAYDECEHRLQSRQAYAAGGDPDACCSTFIHLAPAAAVPHDEPREFSAPRQFYCPAHYALRPQSDPNDVHGQH